MPDHPTGTREEWLAARRALLAHEKELTRLSDELAEQRRALPWVRIDEDYRFQTAQGEKSLIDLFDGRSQLLIYHFMFGPDYQAGCPTCSATADGLDGILVHLQQRDVTMILASRAPLPKLQAYQRRMGWSIPWVSTSDSRFNFDFDVSTTREQQRSGPVPSNFTTADLKPFLDDPPAPFVALAASTGTDVAGYLTEAPGLSAFVLADGVAWHTWSGYARGVEFLLGFYPLLDRAPKGRNEGDPPEMWIRRHDEYPVAGGGSAR